MEEPLEYFSFLSFFSGLKTPRTSFLFNENEYGRLILDSELFSLLSLHFGLYMPKISSKVSSESYLEKEAHFWSINENKLNDSQNLSAFQFINFYIKYFYY